MKRYFFYFILALITGTTACKKPNFEDAPTSRDVGTINQYLNNNFDFSLFAAAVKKVGFADSLNTASSAFTVFAPTNTAFNKVGIYAASDFDNWSNDSLKQFVYIHILEGKLFYNTIPITADTRYTNLAGINLSATIGKVSFTIDGVIVQKASSLSTTVTTYGATALNGVVYPLTNTIKASKHTVTDFLMGRPDFTCLITGLKKFGYWEQLSGQGPFTIFAPPDSVFAKRGFTVDSINKMDATQFNPIVFGGYFLTPNHVFISDVFNLPPTNGKIVLPFPSPDPNYATVIGQGPMGNGAGIVTGASAQTNAFIGVGPNAQQQYGQQGTPFKGEVVSPIQNINTNPLGTYINYTFSNGIVHLMDDIMVMPGLVQKTTVKN